MAKKIKINHENVDLERLYEAFKFAAEAHQGQTRASGEPFVFHVISVAEILLSLNLDTPSLMAALLHDVVEDTDITLAQLENKFGNEVATLVDSVTKMKAFANLKPDIHGAIKKDGLKAENLRKLLLAMAEDVRVVMIKLADRLHNMRTLGSLSAKKQKLIASETAEIYAPLANRLGIWQLKWELEDLAFRFLDDHNYKKIAKSLAERKVDRDKYIDEVVQIIQENLEKNHIKGEVTGRSKHIYSIWKKMQRKNLGFHQLYDLRAVRIHVDQLKDCYHALGVVHTIWKHIPYEFDDYIATPKENNYQSIHTAVVGPQGKTLEIQIRTYDMHKHAEYGVAAHWRYKEGGKQSGHYEQKIAWLRQLLEWRDEEKNAGDFIDRFKSEVFQDRVYVMTPEGEIIDMPQGATPLDFAFYVHTEVGARCRGAKVNGKMVPLTYELISGEQVHVLTTKNGSPSRDWLNPQLGYLKTSRARAKVRHWFKQQDHEQNLLAGREILEKELHRLGISNISHEKLAHHFHFDKTDHLFAEIGRGEITTGQIASTIQELGGHSDKHKEHHEEPIQQTIELLPQGSGDVTIYGVDNVLTQIAQCCKPVPGDSIIGFITKYRGITIHRSDCHNVQHALEENSERLIEVEWNHEVNQCYTVTIELIAMDRQGLLRDITSILANLEINVLGINTSTNKSDYSARMRLSLEIAGVAQLSRALNRITQLPNVIEVYRVSD
ncbi:MAG: GTP diphosphokinase [gamma proteobacterium symbiont of Bathyaustriella thionipta]|nr:GTP diphosphokinase [gamma proteobacterium symbiont of Bathyaustriella thionipta]MCU7950498.1 GTP diphosphokinase [gamma proteobacterium symbiont of Bathyaustriella thionipta]MCU7953167.1 GTP diphosphokinase [gamma proteobacterium symbiont of Bathyaustriella thionipta]MCU7956992.1 GTP diphosphokinase [gamma proteobacterium symbiont of Bathyaustriella thionipta]